MFFLTSSIRQPRSALVTGVQSYALPICIAAYGSNHRFGHPADRIQVLQPPGQNRLNCTQLSDVYQVCAYTKVCSRAGEDDTKNAVVCHGVGDLKSDVTGKGG